METATETVKPPMCSEGHVMVISLAFRRASQGSAVVMRNLLMQFSPESFTVVTGTVPVNVSAPIPPEMRVFTVPTTPPFGWRGERFWRDMARPLINYRITNLVRAVRPALILAVYPSLHIFSAAMNAAMETGIPWIAYLHDVVSEQYRGTKYERWAEEVESKMFSSAETVLVTGHGMFDLYRSKRAIECVPLEIPYCEPIPTSLQPQPAGPPYGFMGGSIYSANHKAVSRLVSGAERAGIRFRFAMPESWTNLARYGVAQRPNMEKVHYRVRNEFLAALTDQHILTVGLNWPDECSIAEDELATAFPTKMIEYLASGRPILVHCPEHYFLAKFVCRHECGIVVSTRDIGAIATAMADLLHETPIQLRLRKNALDAARTFSIDRLKLVFSQALQRVFTDKKCAETEASN